MENEKLQNLNGFSIYNADRFLERQSSPLDFITGDSSTGWRAQRNLLKCLNHLPLLRRKEEILKRLMLNGFVSTEISDRNYGILEEHQQGRKTTQETIEKISNTIYDSPFIHRDRGIGELDPVHWLLDSLPIGHMEFHPCDVCNLKCRGCTYGHDNSETKPKPISFPFDKLEKLALFKPESILISGGGEPTLYNSSGKRFDDLVCRIKEILPKSRIAFVTNGTYIPGGDWVKYLDWIRVSVDAAAPDTYERVRGANRFNDVINNVLKYLESPVKFVGVSFLYSRDNISEYVPFAEYFFNLVKRKSPENLKKLNLQYRPLRKDPKDKGREFPEAVTETEIRKTIGDIVSLASSSKEMEDFLRDQTNIEAILGGNSHYPHNFSKCYYSQLFHIVRANGDLRPCFIRVIEPEFLIGNIIQDDPLKIALNSIYMRARRKEDCDPSGCRQCHVNYVLESGLNNKLKPSSSPIVLNDPFF